MLKSLGTGTVSFSTSPSPSSSSPGVTEQSSTDWWHLLLQSAPRSKEELRWGDLFCLHMQILLGIRELGWADRRGRGPNGKIKHPEQQVVVMLPCECHKEGPWLPSEGCFPHLSILYQASLHFAYCKHLNLSGRMAHMLWVDTSYCSAFLSSWQRPRSASTSYQHD